MNYEFIGEVIGWVLAFSSLLYFAYGMSKLFPEPHEAYEENCK